MIIDVIIFTSQPLYIKTLPLAGGTKFKRFSGFTGSAKNALIVTKIYVYFFINKLYDLSVSLITELSVLAEIFLQLRKSIIVSN